MPRRLPAALERELEHHEKLYSGFAQDHFKKPAVRAFRQHLARRILRITGTGRNSRLLSLGCGIGDTELLLAPSVGEIVGIDLSPAGIAQAREEAARAGVSNVQFIEGPFDEVDLRGSFDAIIAIFFLHHLPDGLLTGLPERLRPLLKHGAVFYSLDPSRYRLTGAVGRLLFPNLMRRYQSPDERELIPHAATSLFRDQGFECRLNYYDFVSTPLAGIFPGWVAGYRAARILDEALTRIPGVRLIASNFEILARSRWPR
jgi:ubiquinone/menaquinone biosynthesis C-methylase UbiE